MWLNCILITGVAYICCLLRMIVDHVVHSVPSEKDKQLLVDFCEAMAFIYFIGYRALQTEMFQIMEILMPNAYRSSQIDIIKFQWLHLRGGVAVFDLLFSRRKNMWPSNTVIATFCLLTLVNFHSPRYLGITIGMFNSID